VKTRHGQCDPCKTGWVWTRNVLLRDQRCPSCGGRLGRIVWRLLADEASRRESDYSWIDIEGYVHPGKTKQ
jgi:hypothetical protein